MSAHPIFPRALTLACALTLLPCLAGAQTIRGGPTSTPGLGNGNRAAIPPSPSPEITTGRPDTRPQLNAGAVLCSSQDDLERYLAILAAKAAGETPPAGPPLKCQRVTESAPVQVVERRGQARTEVKIAGKTTLTGQTGWTDAWLPDRR